MEKFGSKKNMSSSFLCLNILAPVYFLLFSALRCYLETGLLSKRNFFSYYTLLHHTLWNTTTVLAIILVVHLVLKIPVQRLLWLMYGVTLMAIPLIYSLIMGEKLQLGYLRGSFLDIIKHSFTFCLTYGRNNPLTMELIIIFISIFWLGYFCTKNWLKAFGLAVAVHITGNFLAVYWFGVGPSTGAIFPINTQLGNHSFLSVIYLHSMTFLAMILIYRVNFLSLNEWIICSLYGLIGWVLYLTMVITGGFFVEIFDIIMSGLPVFTGLFFLRACFFLSYKKKFHYYFLIMILIFFIQLAVMFPIYIQKDYLLVPQV